MVSIQVKNDQSLNFEVVNVYAPTKPSARSSFFDSITQYMSNVSPVVLAGDFNMVEDPWRDKLGSRSTYATIGIKELNQIKTDFNLIDVWRSLYPYKKQFSWSTTDQSLQSRIDRIYVDSNLIPVNPSSKIIPFPWSDHDIVTCNIIIPTTTPPGPGTWKFNTSLLEDKHYVAYMRRFFVEWRKEKVNFNDIGKWWDIGKLHIKTISKEFASFNNAQAKFEVSQAQKELEEEQNKVNPNPVVMQNARDVISTHEQAKNKGIFIRSKCQFYEEYEKPTKYFYNLINQNKSSTTIVELINDEGKCTSDVKEINRQTHSFYSKLYSKQSTNTQCQNQLLLNLTRKLNSEQSQDLEKPYSKEELFRALLRMKRGKSPGIDGLPMEFYLFFWSDIQDDFLEVVSSSYDNSILSKIMRTAILTLVFKKGDKRRLKNWRPISLLCADYKIIAAAMAGRLKKLLAHLTSPDQTCSVPKRSIFSNLRITRDLIKFTKDKNIEAVILNLDQEKAFDRVDHDFMDKVLNTMNIGPNFRKWVKTLYSQILCKIYNNGNLSAAVTIMRGVRQGCPLSALLYILIAETLGETIRQDPILKGIRIPGKKGDVRISQYADDTTLFLLDPHSLKRALEIINIYEKATGALLNFDKTSAMLIGNRFKHKFDPTEFHLNWVNNTGIKILGITFFNDYFHTQNFNWTNQINKLTSTLDAWKSRTLSHRGKATVVNNLALSKIWYLGSIVEPRKKALKAIKSSIFKFLWNEKMEQVSRDTVFLPLNKGGLGVINPEIQIQALHLKFFSDIRSVESEEHWVYLAKYWIGRRIGVRDQRLRYLSHNNNRPHSQNYPNFYRVFVKFVPLHLDLFAEGCLETRTIYLFLLKAYYNRVNPLDKQRIFSYTGPNQWNHETLLKLPWDEGWKLSYRGYNPYYEQDCLWKLRHHTTITGVRLHTKLKNVKGINRMGKNCKVCALPETALHVFAECRIAHTVWKHFLPFLQNILPPQTLFIQPHIMLGLFHQPGSPKEDYPYRLAITLTSSIVYSLWLARNKHRFDGIAPRTDNIIRNIAGKMADLLHHKFRHFKQTKTIKLFKRHFAINNTLCTVLPNQELAIHIK